MSMPSWMLMIELTPFFIALVDELEEEAEGGTNWCGGAAAATSRFFSGVVDIDVVVVGVVASGGNRGMTGLLLPGGVERNDLRREWLNALPGFL